MKQKKEPRRHGPSWQTILVILGAVALWMGFSMLINTNGGNAGEYTRYAGPVLPMTAVDGGEKITAERNVDLDFTPYANYEPSPIREGEIAVTDSYRLTNPGTEAVTVRLAYPYEGRLVGERKYMPAITVNGEEAEAELLPSLDRERAFDSVNDFQEYKKAMQETDFYAQAAAAPPGLDIPVKVYHFTDITYTGAQDYPYIFLTMDFTVPEGVEVWVRHYDVIRTEEDRVSLWFQEDLDERDGAYLLVMNGDVEDLTFGGNLGHNVTKTSALTDVTCEYETYDASFGDMVWQFAQNYDYFAMDDYDADPDLVTPEILYRDAMKWLEDTVGKGYDAYSGSMVHVVEDAFYACMSNSRLMYWVFDVEIPAGETAAVEAKYHQEASIDTGGPKKRREGYDVATRLGSELDFASQTASLTGSEYIEILRQNFGFAPEKGITEVTLDMAQERYYLEVLIK